MGLPPDLTHLLQSVGGAAIVGALTFLLTWLSRNRDSLRKAEREMRAELREDVNRLEKKNELLEQEVLSLKESVSACRAESHQRQEEIIALKESVLRIKNDFWVQYNAERSPEKKN